MKTDDSSTEKEDVLVEKYSKGKKTVHNLKQEEKNTSAKFDLASFKILEENQNIKKVELPNLELNKLLKKQSMLGLQGSICWKSFLFPSLLNFSSIPNNTHQYFGLDLVDEETERTYWTHKASIWQGLFHSVQQLVTTNKVEPISTMFNGILACPVRAVPNGPNEIQGFKSGKGQLIQHWIMLVPMPPDIQPSNYIMDFIGTFESLCKKPFIKSAYKTGVESITKHQGLIDQLSEDGAYWSVIDNTSQKDIIFKSMNNLSEVLMDAAIKEVVHLMFGVSKNSDTWTDSLKTYAFST